MTEARKQNLGTRIFKLLREISESNSNTGLLIVFSDIYNVLKEGAYPNEGFEEKVHIYNKRGSEILKEVGGSDGAVLINERGIILSPSVYLNVNIFSIDKKEIKKEYTARHIAALATSASTKALVYTLSEETGKVREFAGGRVRREYEPIIQLKNLNRLCTNTR